MKIRFHGVGAGVQRYREGCCSLSIEADGKQILVDVGAGDVLNNIVPVRKLDAIFLTHTHLDHVLYLRKLIDKMRREDSGKYHIDIYSPKRFNFMLWRQQMKKDGFSYKVHHKLPSCVKELKVDRLATLHRVNSYAYRIASSRKSIIVTGDTAYFDDLAEFARDADALVVEATYPEYMAKNAQKDRHMTLRDVVKLGHKARPKLLVTTHYGSHVNPQQAEEYLRENYDGKFVCARRGTEILLD